jgi:CDGSH-type Zn-finger protein
MYKGFMARVIIKCAENGPNLIESDGTVFAAMCRCGGTNTKPYCDGAHAKIGFKAESKEIVVSE